jgi:hypothetical protein
MDLSMANPRRDPPPVEIKEFLSYDPETGIFRWVKQRSGCVCGIAGTKNGAGYISVRFRRRQYKAHRLAWWWVTGEWPEDEIDHRDTDHSNNRFANLREASHPQNMCNTRPMDGKSSKYKGVSFAKSRGGWLAHITVNRKQVLLGRFDEEEAAARAYDTAALEHFGGFARPNFTEAQHGL